MGIVSLRRVATSPRHLERVLARRPDLAEVVAEQIAASVTNGELLLCLGEDVLLQMLNNQAVAAKGFSSVATFWLQVWGFQGKISPATAKKVLPNSWDDQNYLDQIRIASGMDY